MKEITVFTRAPGGTERGAFRLLVERAAEAGVSLRLDAEETRKLSSLAGPAVELDAEVKDDVDLCLVLGGDGTILRALQRYAGTEVPVFSINFRGRSGSWLPSSRRTSRTA